MIFKNFRIFFIFILFIGSLANAEKLSKTAYFAGGLTGTILGLGLGHAIEGRWIQDGGWIFTGLELGAIYGFSKEKIVANNCTVNSTGNATCSTGTTSAGASYAFGYVIIRIWEIVDVWILPKGLKLSFLPLPDERKLILSYRF